MHASVGKRQNDVSESAANVYTDARATRKISSTSTHRVRRPTPAKLAYHHGHKTISHWHAATSALYPIQQSAIRLISHSGPESRHSLTPLALLSQWYDCSQRRHKPKLLVVAFSFLILRVSGW
jgi:hypothetical protein